MEAAADPPQRAPDIAPLLQCLGIYERPLHEQKKWITDAANKQSIDALVPAKTDRSLLQEAERQKGRPSVCAAC